MAERSTMTLNEEIYGIRSLMERMALVDNGRGSISLLNEDTLGNNTNTETNNKNFDNMSFKEAFNSAYKQGLKTFMWKGKMYAVKFQEELPQISSNTDGSLNKNTEIREYGDDLPIDYTWVLNIPQYSYGAQKMGYPNDLATIQNSLDTFNLTDDFTYLYKSKMSELGEILKNEESYKETIPTTILGFITLCCLVIQVASESMYSSGSGLQYFRLQWIIYNDWLAMGYVDVAQIWSAFFNTIEYLPEETFNKISKEIIITAKLKRKEIDLLYTIWDLVSGQRTAVIKAKECFWALAWLNAMGVPVMQYTMKTNERKYWSFIKRDWITLKEAEDLYDSYMLFIDDSNENRIKINKRRFDIYNRNNK